MQALTQQQFDQLHALKCAVAYNQYGGYCVPLSSRHRVAARAILSNHVYEPKTIEFLISNCTDGDIVHAGTYFGDFLPALSASRSAGSMIWAFEPNAENFRCAEITLLINAIDNVELRHAGLGDRLQTGQVRVADSNGRALGGLSVILTEEQADNSGRTEQVDILTIDETIPADRAVSVIQLDVEGFEAQALAGAMATIRRCRPVIVLEVLAGRDFVGGKWFSENILQIEYAEVGSVHGNAIFACKNKHPAHALNNIDPVLTAQEIDRL